MLSYLLVGIGAHSVGEIPGPSLSMEALGRNLHMHCAGGVHPFCDENYVVYIALPHCVCAIATCMYVVPISLLPLVWCIRYACALCLCSHGTQDGLSAARKLCESLIQTVQKDHETWKRSQQPLGFGGQAPPCKNTSSLLFRASQYELPVTTSVFSLEEWSPKP